MKEEGLGPETFRCSALSSLSPLTSRATRGLGGREGFLSGTAASPEPQRNTGLPNKAGEHTVCDNDLPQAKEGIMQAGMYKILDPSLSAGSFLEYM